MASNCVLDHLEQFSCGPGGHNFADGTACSACGKNETPHLTCIFCNLDGVERYGGICDEHTVANGAKRPAPSVATATWSSTTPIATVAAGSS